MSDTELIAKMCAAWFDNWDSFSDLVQADSIPAMTRVLALVREHDAAQLATARAEGRLGGMREALSVPLNTAELRTHLAELLDHPHRTDATYRDTAGRLLRAIDEVNQARVTALSTPVGGEPIRLGELAEAAQREGAGEP